MQVHEGMMQAATFVHTNAYEALQAAAGRFPGWPVLLTGHSMGGIHSPTIAQTRLALDIKASEMQSLLSAFLCMKLSVQAGPLQYCHLIHAICNPVRCCTGGVAAILTALLRDGGAPEGLGPAACIALGCAAVFSRELAEAVTPFTTSVIYGSVLLCLQSGQGLPMISLWVAVWDI